MTGTLAPETKKLIKDTEAMDQRAEAIKQDEYLRESSWIRS